MKMLTKTVCQSCGAPLSKDSEKGKEIGGGISEHYCRRCYQMGSFTEPQMTADKMHEVVRLKMLELKFPRFLAVLLANNIYNLQRWKTAKN
jgi:predicted amidophosphoribosyltransferase